MKWQFIKNYSDWQVSDIGGLIRNRKTKEIKSTYIQNKGYPMVSLEGKAYLVHRLVAEAYVPNPDNKPQVDQARMRKGPETMKRKAIERKQSPEWERIEAEYLARQREWHREYYAENKDWINARKHGMTLDEYLQWKEERRKRSQEKKEAQERAQARKQWVKDHPEEEKARKKEVGKKWYEKNKEKLSVQRKAYRLAHLEEIRAKDRERKKRRKKTKMVD